MEVNSFDNIAQPSQLDMKNILISKLKQYKNVDIKTKEETNNVGIYYSITAHIKLSDFGNGLFHSATLKTVTYNKRTVNIKCVFTDNKNLHHDMKIDRDSVFQCFRDIAPDTITSISLEDFNDQSDEPHLRIIASTIKGSSLIYVYKRLMDFVKIINDKYGNLIINSPESETKPISIPKPALEFTLASTPPPAPAPIKLSTLTLPVKPTSIQEVPTFEVVTPAPTQVSESKYVSDSKPSRPVPIPKNTDNIRYEKNTTISKYNLSENTIKELEEEEKRLQIILDTIRLLKQTHIDCLKVNSEVNPDTNLDTKQETKGDAKPDAKGDTKENVSSQISFASKVKQSLKK